MRLITRIAKEKTIHKKDGEGTFLNAISKGLQPDPSLPLDEWSDTYMVIPRSTGAAEYGKYRTSRTPHARQLMQALSIKNKCRRVVLMAASQMLKTQVALNFFCYIVHQHPANFLWLMPTGKLHKRIVLRIDRVIEAVDVVRQRVAPPGRRDATNSQDIKVFQGGSLFIATAGSAANLAEVPAKFVSFDEIDRADASVDGEGDPVKLAEGRQTTFAETAKSYYYSSPTDKETSRIYSLYNEGTQRVAMAECAHCGHAQELDFFKLTSDAKYPCIECGGMHSDHDKAAMFKNGLWTDPKNPDATDESFNISAMFQPYGWLSWANLVDEYKCAKDAYDKGDEEQLIVFYNTRLALAWEAKAEQSKPVELMARAEDYKLGIVPKHGLVLTAAIDTQADRLECKVVAWGDSLECWIVAYYIVMGDPGEYETFEKLLELIDRDYDHQTGGKLRIDCTFIDSGGLNTQDVYDFTSRNKYLNIFAIKGSSNSNHLIIAKRPSKVDYNKDGKHIKKAVELWHVGTVAAKDYIHSRLKRTEGPGTIHFSKDLPAEYYEQLLAETRVVRYSRGRKVFSWEKPRGARNEALDLMGYNVAAAYKLQLHTKPKEYWVDRINDLEKGKEVKQDNGKISLINWARK